MLRNQHVFLACLCGVIVGILSSSLIAQTANPADQPPPESPTAPLLAQSDAGVIKLLSPLPENGTVPPIVEWHPEYEQELAYRARVRGYDRQLKIIRYKYFGVRKLARLRQQGFDELTEFTDPAATGLLFSCIATNKEVTTSVLMRPLAASEESGARWRSRRSRTAFCLALPDKPRNSETNSRIVRSRPRSAS